MTETVSKRLLLWKMRHQRQQSDFGQALFTKEYQSFSVSIFADSSGYSFDSETLSLTQQKFFDVVLYLNFNGTFEWPHRIGWREVDHFLREERKVEFCNEPQPFRWIFGLACLALREIEQL